MGEIPAKDLFMMCEALREEALAEVPRGFSVRRCRKGEWDVWKALQMDGSEKTAASEQGLRDYYDHVYAKQGDAFFERCLFACDENDRPVGTCMMWLAYNKVNTLHWFKVLEPYEGKGIGRALLSCVMRQLPVNEYPVFLHTHPTSYRAIKLYSDFGFALLTDPQIGFRSNDILTCMPILEQVMPAEAFRGLQTKGAPPFFLEAALSAPFSEF